jgi:2-methylaconitate cis-trans-isomerase PrpF
MVGVKTMGMRGGTSKFWVCAEEELSAVAVDRDRLLVRPFGSRDVGQTEGIDGAASMTSKAALAPPWQLRIALPAGSIA